MGRTGFGSELTRAFVIAPRQRELLALQAASLEAPARQAQRALQSIITAARDTSARDAALQSIITAARDTSARDATLQSIVTAAKETSARDAALLSASRVAPFSRAALQRAEQAIANAMAPYAEHVARAQRTVFLVARMGQQHEAMAQAFRRDFLAPGEALRLWKPPFDVEAMRAPGHPSYASASWWSLPLGCRGGDGPHGTRQAP